MSMHTDPTIPPTAPAPQQKNWFARHKVLTVLGGIVALIIVISVAGGGGDKPAESASDTAVTAEAGTDAEATEEKPAEEKPAEEPAKEGPGFGDPVIDKDLEFTALSVEGAGAKVGSEYLSAEAQGTFHRLTLRVANVGKSAELFTLSSLTLVDEQGREFSADTTATTYADPDNGMWLSEINPGNAVEGGVIFDLPAGAVPTELIASGGLFGDGVTIALK